MPDLLAAQAGRVRAVVDGPWCERIFGPLAELACACGKYQGAAHDGATCDRCGVRCVRGGLRDQRWGYVQLPHALHHPAGLDVDVVPVPPPGDRPMFLVDDPAAPSPRPGLINLAYAQLIAQANRWRHLDQVGAPDELMDRARRRAQRAFTIVLDAVARGDAAAAAAWVDADEPELEGTPIAASLAPRLDGDDPDPARVALVFIDARRLAVQRGRALDIVATVDGAVEARIDFGSATALSSDGRVVIGVCPPDYLDEADACCGGVVAYDLATAAWIEVPASVPKVAFAQAEPETGWLEDARHGRTVPVEASTDRPRALAWAHGHGHVWIGEGDPAGVIVDTTTGFVAVRVGATAIAPTPLPTLSAAGASSVRAPRAGRLDGAAAIALTPARRWRLVARTGLAFELDGARFQLGFAAMAAAFEPGGARLAVLTGTAIVIIAWDERAVVARLPRPRAPRAPRRGRPGPGTARPG